MLLVNAALATMDGNRPFGLIGDGALACENGRIAWVGSRSELPERWHGVERTDMEGRLVTPALIDCHTHLVHGGDRSLEFEMRLQGASYQEIARAGGGILSTVAATRTSVSRDTSGPSTAIRKASPSFSNSQR